MDGSGTPLGTSQTQPDGSVTLSYTYVEGSGGTPAQDVVLQVPADYATENPTTGPTASPVANIAITATQNGQILPPVSLDVPVVVTPEGDADILVPAAPGYTETDAAVVVVPGMCCRRS